MSSKGENFRDPSNHRVEFANQTNGLLGQIFDLIAQKHIKPIAPMTIFPFEGIPAAFRYMRGGNHIGKIVISNGPDAEIHIPVSYQTLFQTDLPE